MRARFPSVTNFLLLRAELFRAGAGDLVESAMRRDMAALPKQSKGLYWPLSMVRPRRIQIQAGDLSGVPATVCGKITAWTSRRGGAILEPATGSHEHDHRDHQSGQHDGCCRNAARNHPGWDLLLTFGRKTTTRCSARQLWRA